MTLRPEFYHIHNGEQAVLPFFDSEYEARLAVLRANLEAQDCSVAIFTSMHNIAYYCGFLYCAFGRPYALIVTAQTTVVISAGIDAGQPWRRCYGDCLTYSDWQRDNFWRAVHHVIGLGQEIGYEADHLTMAQCAKLDVFLKPTYINK